MGLKHWLQQTTNRRVAERRLLQGFAAAYYAGSDLRQGVIHDISATGIFLATSDTFEPGTSVPLLLHRIGPSGGEQHVSIDARVVRCSEEGVAFAFEIPSGVDLALWINLVDTATYESETDDIIAPFKLARAMAFLTRISAPSGTHARQHVRANLTGLRLWNGVEILLKAESYLAAFPNRKEVPCGGLAARIVEEGSWTESEALMHDWAGLLAAACSGVAVDNAGRTLVDLFSQLTLTHVRIMNEACTRSAKYLTPDGRVAALPLTAGADEIMRFSDSRDLLRMGRALEHLAELGLLEERLKTSMFVPLEGIKITPTSLGLQLHARCAGHIGTLESFYGVSRSVAIAAAG